MIAGHPAIISAPVGAGRVVVFGVRVQHRAQSIGHLPPALQRYLHIALIELFFLV